MVHGDRQRVPDRAELDEQGANQRPGPEIEGQRRLGSQEPVQRRFERLSRPLQGLEPEGERRGRPDHLEELAVFQDECGPKRLVPLLEVGKRGAERGHVELAGQAQPE